MLRFSFSFVVFTFVASIFLSASEGSAQSQRADVSPTEMRQIAASAIVNGDPRLGYQLATALLKRDPNDTEALIIRARAARDLGRLPEAVATARRAWGNADTSSERFGASMVMAQALSTSGARTRAQLWLRRAAQNAPSDEFKNIAVRDFRYVKRTNPWATEFSFSVSPNSNINNGSRNSSTRLFDLPFQFQLSGSAQALSGLEYSTQFATRFRVAESQTNQHDLFVNLDHRTYTLSEEAKLLAPNAEGTDFEYTDLRVGYIRRGFSGSNQHLPHEFVLSGGRTSYGRSPFMQYVNIGFKQIYLANSGQQLHLEVSRRFEKSLSARADAHLWQLRSGMRLSLANRDRLSLNLDAKKSNSTDAHLDYLLVRAEAKYALARPIAGVSLDFSFAIGQKIHERSNFSRFGRREQKVSVEVTGVFKQIEYFGFSPSVTLSASKTKSNIGLFESESVGLRMGIQSSF